MTSARARKPACRAWKCANRVLNVQALLDFAIESIPRLINRVLKTSLGISVCYIMRLEL